MHRKRAGSCPLSAIPLSSILVAAQRGDLRAQAQLADLVMKELKTLIAKAARAVPRADREDVRQETFLNLIQPRRLFDPAHPRANAKAYIYNAARSASDAKGRGRASARFSDSNPDEIAVENSAPAEVHDALRVAHDIDAKLYEIVKRIECDGVTAKEAGGRTGMSPSAVCRALHQYAAACSAALRDAA